MALTQMSLEVGRRGINKLFFIEAEKIPAQYNDVLKVEKTDETSPRRKQMAGLAPAVETDEGQRVAYDDPQQLHQRDFSPVLFTKGVKFSKQTKYTDQYGVVAKMQPMFAKAFMDRKNMVAADLDNLGFTATTAGMNSEALYETTHTVGSYSQSNRPATDIVFGVNALEQALKELRKQETARDTPAFIHGKVKLLVPRDLEASAYRVVNSMSLPGGNDNDPNWVRNIVDVAVIDYYTSTTAWFLRALDDSLHGKFLLEQMPYDMEKLPMDDELMHKWVASESYIAGWDKFHGSWGTTGA